ncbi:hypothetical protein ACIRP3_34755 [Streptomyces sp. NPDC101209]|uniref:hypothetical protein n=1 Tax=Streptomyces sp. NPDC101209 TaxID=3366129 RepID=UPI0038162A86
MKTQSETIARQEISGVVDALVTANQDADGALAFHLVVGPADRPGECDRIEFSLDAEHAAALFGTPTTRPTPFTVPCRVGVELHSAPYLHH